MKYLLIITVFILFSCKPTKDITPKETVSKNVVFTEISSGTNGNFSEKTNKVITNQTDFNTAWVAAHERFAEQPKPARIDFENNLILLVTMGVKNSGSYSTEITSITSNTNLTVTVTEINPGNSCVTTDVMTFPYQIIQIDKTDKKIVFEYQSKTIECNE